LSALKQCLGIGERLALHAARQILHDAGGRGDTDVRREQQGLELLHEIVVDALATDEECPETVAERLAGPRQAFAQSREDAGPLFRRLLLSGRR
jgi:hypothetical protein